MQVFVGGEITDTLMAVFGALLFSGEQARNQYSKNIKKMIRVEKLKRLIYFNHFSLGRWYKVMHIQWKCVALDTYNNIQVF